MKKGLFLVSYFALLTITLIKCVMWLDVWGLLLYFVLGIIYILPFKLYQSYKEKKNKTICN